MSIRQWTISLAALFTAMLLVACGTLQSATDPVPPLIASTATPQVRPISMAAPTSKQDLPAWSITPRPTLEVEPLAEHELTSYMFLPMSRIADALRALKPLIRDPQLGNADWTRQVARQIDIIQTAYDDLWDLELFLKRNEFYNQTMNATGSCIDATDHLKLAIEESDEDGFRRANKLLQLCRAQLKQLGSS